MEKRHKVALSGLLFFSFSLFLFIVQLASIVGVDQHISIIGEGRCVFPCCLGNGITFSFHVVLISSSSSPMFEDHFNFIDFFAL
jgi:hypothetical protein